MNRLAEALDLPQQSRGQVVVLAQLLERDSLGGETLVENEQRNPNLRREIYLFR